MTWLFRILISAALLGSITSTLSVYPHQLAYFNEASGGPENGYKHLLGSNLDWGQDLLLVRNCIRERTGVHLLSISSTSGVAFNLSSIGLFCQDPLATQNKKLEHIHQKQVEWLSTKNILYKRQRSAIQLIFTDSEFPSPRSSGDLGYAIEFDVIPVD